MRSVQAGSKLASGLAWLFMICGTATAQWFVNVANSGEMTDGLSWGTAFTSIQPGIDAAQAAGGGEVWVAAGTYSESRESIVDVDRREDEEFFADTGSVLIQTGVDLLGGFVGSEISSTERDPDANVTTISGATSLNGESASHVVYMKAGATIDGFVVRGGVADGPAVVAGGIQAPTGTVSIRNVVVIDNFADFPPSAIQLAGGELVDSKIMANGADGGGARMYATDTLIENCLFTDGATGSILVLGASTVIGCTFADNLHGAGSFRGNTLVDSCTFLRNGGITATVSLRDFAQVRNSLFLDNTSPGSGGAILISRGVPVIENCVFANNTAVGNGGAISISGGRGFDIFSNAQATLINCTFYGNSAGGSGDAIYNLGADVLVHNSLFWNNCPEALAGDGRFTFFVTNSLIEGGFVPLGQDAFPPTAVGIVDVPPQFMDAAIGDFHLSATSPAIDAGTLEIVRPQFNFPENMTAPDTDFDGVMRPQPENGAWDLGAYEFIPGETGPGTEEESLCPAIDEGEGETEGSSEGMTEGATEGSAEGEGEPEGMTEGSSEGMPEGAAEGGGEGMPEGSTEGSGDGNGEGATEGSTEGMNEGASEGFTEGDSEGVTEGSSEGSTEGGNEGSGEGDSEGSAEGMAEGASEGTSEGTTEGNGDTHGGCPWNNDAAFAPPTDSARQNAGTILVLALTGVVLLRRGKRRDYGAAITG